ncbi:MAG: 3-carboxyethylcatechol 2,3-dioxygenase [Pseudomonadota bacterium]
MPVQAIFSSHTPLMDFHDPDPGVRDAVERCFAELRGAVAAFNPERVIVMGPDHFNGFFYRVMPSFCVGAAATSVGDWATPSGALNVDVSLAERCVSSMHRGGVDVAISYDMDVDHGISQIINQLFEWQQMPTVLPVFINCAAPPRPPIARVVRFGQRLGEFVDELGGRTLMIASGGLSHDPPLPQLADASPPVRDRLVQGGTLNPEARQARQQRVLDDAANQAQGISDRLPLNPEWDQKFLQRLASFDFADIGEMTDETITREGGCGGHEIRSWIAVAAASQAAGVAKLEQLYYRAIPQWVAGFGIMRSEA